MLSDTDNALLTRTGPGEPMGELFRRFWLPVILSGELPGPDCAPLRVRLLGEDLIAFRDTSGAVGLIAQQCPHRGASLFFGRNEETGLRCVYHGWKFDTAGRCVDMPNEPAESSFKERVRATAYPCRERSGIVWAYLGPRELMPELPDLEWARVPESHVVINKYIVSCNYMQAMEGDLDSAHVSFLHKRLDAYRMDNPNALTSMARLTSRDRAPRFTVKDTSYGLMIGARRDAADDRYYWRISQWLLPAYDMIGHDAGVAMSGHALVPVDDEHVWFWAMRWEGDRPMTDEEHTAWSREGARVAVQPGSWLPIANQANDYRIDRTVQRTETYTGIPGIGEQDLAVTESMGPIVKRSAEHLGTTDLAIIAARRRLLQTARELQQGVEPYAASHPEIYHIRPTSAILPRTIPFDLAPEVQERTTARA